MTTPSQAATVRSQEKMGSGLGLSQRDISAGHGGKEEQPSRENSTEKAESELQRRSGARVHVNSECKVQVSLTSLATWCIRSFWSAFAQHVCCSAISLSTLRHHLKTDFCFAFLSSNLLWGVSLIPTFSVFSLLWIWQRLCSSSHSPTLLHIFL